MDPCFITRDNTVKKLFCSVANHYTSCRFVPMCFTLCWWTGFLEPIVYKLFGTAEYHEQCSKHFQIIIPVLPSCCTGILLLSWISFSTWAVFRSVVVVLSLPLWSSSVTFSLLAEFQPHLHVSPAEFNNWAYSFTGSVFQMSRNFS